MYGIKIDKKEAKMSKLGMVFLIAGGIGLLLGSIHVSAQTEGSVETEPVVEEWAQTGSYKVDTDKDGKLSLEEYMAHHEKRFKSMDLDSDGLLTQQEAQQASFEKRTGRREEIKKRIKKRQTQSE